MVKKIDIPDPIIVVEDDADDQYLIKAICDELGITAALLFFDNGKDALDYLNTTDKNTFIILCDINMPLMNGLELRKRINENEYLRRKSIPFVFLSTAARPSDIAEAYDLTVQGFFIKESDFAEMREALKLIFLYWKRCKHPNSVKASGY